MGKKPQKHTWPEAIKLCRLNQNDMEMAKKLGFQPASLIRARPDPKQKWKLPVKDWISELHYKKFGRLIGKDPLLAPFPAARAKNELDGVRPVVSPNFWPRDSEDYLEEDYVARMEEMGDEITPFGPDDVPF